MGASDNPSKREVQKAAVTLASNSSTKAQKHDAAVTLAKAPRKP